MVQAIQKAESSAGYCSWRQGKERGVPSGKKAGTKIIYIDHCIDAVYALYYIQSGHSST